MLTSLHLRVLRCFATSVVYHWYSVTRSVCVCVCECVCVRVCVAVSVSLYLCLSLCLCRRGLFAGVWWEVVFVGCVCLFLSPYICVCVCVCVCVSVSVSVSVSV